MKKAQQLQINENGSFIVTSYDDVTIYTECEDDFLVVLDMEEGIGGA